MEIKKDIKVRGFQEREVEYEIIRWLCFSWKVHKSVKTKGNHVLIDGEVDRIILNNEVIWKK